MALSPLCFGIAMVPLFAMTHKEWFAAAGLYTLFWGSGAFMIGILCTIVYRATNRFEGAALSARVTKQVTHVVIVLFLNIPAAIVCVFIGLRLVDFGD